MTIFIYFLFIILYFLKALRHISEQSKKSTIKKSLVRSKKMPFGHRIHNSWQLFLYSHHLPMISFLFQDRLGLSWLLKNKFTHFLTSLLLVFFSSLATFEKLWDVKKMHKISHTHLVVHKKKYCEGEWREIPSKLQYVCLK